jgi:hypothetical protein
MDWRVEWWHKTTADVGEALRARTPGPCPTFGARPPAEITRADVKEWIERLSRRRQIEVATRMAEDLSITPFIIAKVMDHKLPGEAEMGDVYSRYDYLAEKRQALTKWGDHLSRLVRKAARVRRTIA